MARFGSPAFSTSAAPSTRVHVMGLDELRRDLRAMDRRIGGKEGITALNREMQRATDLVANHAKTTTVRMAGMVGNERRRRSSHTGKLYGKPRRGYRPGRTSKAIRGKVSKGKGIVETRARSNTGSRFPYPYAYEHNAWKGSGPDSPHREFMYPALYAMRDEVVESLADGMTRIMRQYWHSTSGTTGGVTIA